SHAELAPRVALVETAQSDWRRRLGELHEQVWAVAAPRGTTSDLDNGLRVELRSVVCGDPVRASVDRVHAGDLPTPECAVELAVENRGTEKLHFRDRPARLGDLVAQILRPKDGGAVLEAGACLSLYLRGEPPGHTLSLDVRPAQHAVVRLVSEQAALALGSGRADERALVVLGDGKGAVYLRAD
ncbi:MAG: hypothetical protein HY908_34100, partial [Myxococcales bacterium]|nr:hypothetical protein [Myxococcales bacterium]